VVWEGGCLLVVMVMVMVVEGLCWVAELVTKMAGCLEEGSRQVVEEVVESWSRLLG